MSDGEEDSAVAVALAPTERGCVAEALVLFGWSVKQQNSEVHSHAPCMDRSLSGSLIAPLQVASPLSIVANRPGFADKLQKLQAVRDLNVSVLFIRSQSSRCPCFDVALRPKRNFCSLWMFAASSSLSA